MTQALFLNSKSTPIHCCGLNHQAGWVPGFFLESVSGTRTMFLITKIGKILQVKKFTFLG
jgi:hypothetical protein